MEGNVDLNKPIIFELMANLPMGKAGSFLPVTMPSNEYADTDIFLERSGETIKITFRGYRFERGG